MVGAVSLSSQTRAFTRSKYHAKKVRLDGHCFDSKREAAVYCELKLLAKAGHINALEVHRRIPLHATGPDGIKRKIGEYECDFVFWDALKKTRRYQDVKGFMVPLSMWKIKHCEAEYGIVVEIVR
jgi:hypothetical protein